MGVARGVRTDERLQHADNGCQPLPHLDILALGRLLRLDDGLQLLVRLQAGELLDAPLERLDLVLGAFADGPLRLAVCFTFQSAHRPSVGMYR